MPPHQKPERKPRILWANLACLLDTSNGASIEAREMLRQLVFHGCDVAVLGATLFDSPKGLSRFSELWKTTSKKKMLQVIDAPLEHSLVITRSINRSEMTSAEADTWFSFYQRMLDTFKPDLVYFYGGHSLDLLISIEAKLRGIPAVAYLANGLYEGKRWYQDVDLIITNSQTNADSYHFRQGINPIPVGLFIDPAAAKASDHTRRNLLFINPSLDKGAAIVIQLALLLEKRRADIQFEVVESRGNWPALVRHVTSRFGVPRELLDNVRVTPNTSDMRPVYGRARLLLAPSLCWESAGRVAAEAMLNAVPVICTNRGGLPEMIGNGGIKVTLPEGCYEKPYKQLPPLELLEPLVKKLLQLYDDEALYNDYVARAEHVGATLHQISDSTRRLMEALQTLISKRAVAISNDKEHCLS